ncbi:uncharacterized protein IL334_006061 [Kwoniella shivajii]|uniref:Mutanase n=1 Tax=Kwoniella shivajii TaxID=564305 RepID=A0ABZ1D572_9TREE|nr:hypothetical protein IL334_006061 [Kwoniella shivajii]
MRSVLFIGLPLTASLGDALGIPDNCNSSLVQPASTVRPDQGVNRRQVPTTASMVNNERFVFAHFMVGFVNAYNQEDWNRDIALAASKGIDGFALNCDGQDTNAQQLQYAFTAASSLNFKLFISPDFVHYSYTDPGPVSELLKPYLSESAYFQYEGKPFVSSFWGEGIDWVQIGENVGVDLYVCPYYKSSQAAADTPGLDGLFSWNTWPGQDSDSAVFQNMTTAPDEEYLNLLAPLGKAYMAPVSPWFYSHLPASTGFPKNYHLYSDTLWSTRWQQILELVVAHPDQVKFVEIITWNDWTESSLISPYRGTLTTDGNKEWSEDFDHSAWMDMMGPFISAFKAGQSKPQINEDRIVWWYRPTLKNAECDSTDSVGEKPRGWEMAADSVFVAALTTGPATITVTIGGTSSSQKVDGEGVHTLAFPMCAGSVSFQMTVDGGGTAIGKGNIDITDQCYKGIYNFNVLVGTALVDGSSPSSVSTDVSPSIDISSTVSSLGTMIPSTINTVSTAYSTLPDTGISSYSNSQGSTTVPDPETTSASAPDEATSSYAAATSAPTSNVAPWNGWRNGGWKTQQA